MIGSHHLRIPAATLLALVLLGGLTTRAADEPTPAAANPFIDPQADAALRRMSAALAAAPALSFEVEALNDLTLDNGMRVQLANHHRIIARHPDGIFAETKGDRENAAYWYDGRQLSILDRADNLYAQVDAPATIDATFDHLANEYALTFPLSDLLFADPYAAIIPQVQAAIYLGLHQVHQVPCHHIACRQDTVDWQLWIQQADPPVPRKLVITYKELPGDPQYIAFLSNWNLSAKVDDATFRFQPPPGAQRVELTRTTRSSPAASPNQPARP